MSLQPSSSDTPIITNYTPRGRPVMATIGVLILLGGIVLWGLSSQGIIKLPGLSAIQQAVSSIGGSTSSSIAPQGAAPANFTAYRDPQHRFALYVSQSWPEAEGALTVNGQSTPATEFAPTGTTVPNWRLAFLGTPLPTDTLSATNAIAAILTAEGDKGITPTNTARPVPIGTAQWSRSDLTAQNKNGLNIHIVALTLQITTGAVLVLEEAPTLTFATTESQDFTPMLTSLTIQG